MRSDLVFLRNGRKTFVNSFDPETTLLEYLRLTERKTGTKEGCNEGDCGACTVALGKLRDGKLSYEPVNACILLLGQVDGCDVISVDDLAVGKQLHPVQQSMVKKHGSQCGFCTPGIVMSLFSLFHSGRTVERSVINDWLSGNLCRCTGYRPIVDAGIHAMSKKQADDLTRRWDQTEDDLKMLASKKDLFVGDEHSFFAAPGSLKSLAKLYDVHRDGVIVAGATDVGLWITKQGRKLPKLIHTGRVEELGKVKLSNTKLVIGSSVTYCQAFEKLSELHCDIGRILRRLGSRHVRASATIGGNIANGSPIGDMAPMLIALGSGLELQRGDETRSLALEAFFIEYGKQDLGEGELITKIIVPCLKKKQYFKAWKISKRFDQDISSVMFSCVITVEGDRVVSAKIACGGMAGIPARAKHGEAAISGASLSDPKSWENAKSAFEKDFSPLSDMRASKNYRMKVVQNLLVKAMYEIAEEAGISNSPATRLYEAGEIV